MSGKKDDLCRELFRPPKPEQEYNGCTRGDVTDRTESGTLLPYTKALLTHRVRLTVDQRAERQSEGGRRSVVMHRLIVLSRMKAGTTKRAANLSWRSLLEASAN